jgi:hypothetical protein
MYRTVVALALAGAAPAWAQARPLDLRGEIPRAEPPGVLGLLRQEDEKPEREDLNLSLELVARSPRGRSNVGYGPLHLASQSPLHALRMGISPEAPQGLAPGQWETRETLTWSRMWAQADDYLLSFETLGRSCSVVYGATERLRVELGGVETARFAGDLDGFVKNFHETFALRQGGRDTVREGAYLFRIGDVELREGRANETARTLFASLHYTLTEGNEDVPAVAATFTLSGAPGDAPDLHGDSIGATGLLVASKSWGDFNAYLGAGFAWYGHESFHGLPLRPWGLSVLAAVEWRFLEGASLVLQHLWTPGALEGFGELSRPSYELALGLKIEVLPGSVLEIGGTENILVFDSSPDFGLHAGLSVRF